MIGFFIVCNEEGSWILRKKEQQYEMHMAKWTDVDFPLDLKLTVTFRKHQSKEIQISIKRQPCDSTCSGVELSLLVDSSSSRLGIFFRERNATITKNAGKKAFGGTRYEKISGMVEGPFSTRDGSSTIKEDPLYQSSLEKMKLSVGSGIAFGTFH